jgi:hypothetical protein
LTPLGFGAGWSKGAAPVRRQLFSAGRRTHRVSAGRRAHRARV